MGLFDGTPLQRPITCEICGESERDCRCPTPEDPGLPADRQTLTIRTEKRKRGKTVTVIDGFGDSASHLKHTLKLLKDHCGAGGSSDGQRIELQGDHCVRAREQLLERGYQFR